MSEWAWRFRGNEHDVHGPFDTRDEALDDAQLHLDDDEDAEVWLGRVEYIEPGVYAPKAVDIDWLLEQMDEIVDVDYDPVFEVVGEGADQALADALGDWADKHVKTTVAWKMVDEEIIVL